jgi:wyosine [tRNA(Phe)-imidazoG37] synthetase (radical SAM superfamily)
MSDAPLTISRHSRSLERNRYVYAVLSRRSKGISVGINLNPDKICNFDCIYCQVDRATPPAYREVDEAILEEELESVLARARNGSLFPSSRFRSVPESLRRLSDIAFAGDGEPTTYPRFREVVERVIALKRKLRLGGLKISVLTNCTVLDRPAVREALALLDASDGEIWAKLDAGTEAYYEEVCVPGGAKFSKILSNILGAARVRPVVIQSLFLRSGGQPPSEEEVGAFCDRLREIVDGGGRIRLVQIYTVARRPAIDTVSPLSDAEVNAIAERVRSRTGLSVEAYYGSSDW